MRQSNAIAALGVFFALTAGAPAIAQVCTTTCSEYDEGECVEEEQTCTTPPPPPPAYGAIAYGRKSGAWGDSYNWDSQSKAESTALKNCAAHGKDCEVMVWFRNECGAVVSGKGANAYWGIGDGIGAARGNALNKCTKDGGGKACTVQASECSR
jgi:hypothetical protein